MGLGILLSFRLLIQNIHTETRHSRLPQASELCFRKTPNYFKINHWYKREKYLESYESITLKLAEDDYAWSEDKQNDKSIFQNKSLEQ